MKILLLICVLFVGLLKNFDSTNIMDEESI